MCFTVCRTVYKCGFPDDLTIIRKNNIIISKSINLIGDIAFTPLWLWFYCE